MTCHGLGSRRTPDVRSACRGSGPSAGSAPWSSDYPNLSQKAGPQGRHGLRAVCSAAGSRAGRLGRDGGSAVGMPTVRSALVVERVASPMAGGPSPPTRRRRPAATRWGSAAGQCAADVSSPPSRADLGCVGRGRVQFGPRAVALAAWCSKGLGLPASKVARPLGHLGLKVIAGEASVLATAAQRQSDPVAMLVGLLRAPGQVVAALAIPPASNVQPGASPGRRCATE
jgi:hypothetical protein